MLRPFGLTAVFTVWQFAPVVTGVVVVCAGLYLWGAARVARRHPGRPWPAWRTGMFLGGLAVVVLATESGIGAYDDLLYTDHMVQHLMLIMVAPPLLIFSQPITLLLHASRNPLHRWVKAVLRSRVASFLTWPVFGCAGYAAAIMGAHLTGLANLVESNQALHDTEHAVFLVIGYLFLLPLIGSEPIRWRLSYPVRFFVLVLIMPVDTFTGLMLGYGSASTPGVPAGPRPAWAPPPVSDLHTGGAVMWIGGDGLMFALMMVVYLMWSTDRRAGTAGRGWLEAARRASIGSLVTAHTSQSAAGGSAVAGGTVAGGTVAGSTGPQATAAGSAIWEGRGGIDDDEHLAAYNAFLARLNEGDSGSSRR